MAEIVAGKAARQDDVGALQREDLVALGRLLLQLACCMPQHPSLEYCAAHFSPELTHIIASLLLQHQEPILSWRQVGRTSSSAHPCTPGDLKPTPLVYAWG